MEFIEHDGSVSLTIGANYVELELTVMYNGIGMHLYFHLTGIVY